MQFFDYKNYTIIICIILLFSTLTCNIFEPVNIDKETYDDFLIKFSNGDFSFDYIGWEIDIVKKEYYLIDFVDNEKINKCAKIYVPKTERRTELTLNYPSDYGRKIFYRWKYKLDSTYVLNDIPQTIHQFHDKPDLAIGEDWDNYTKRLPPVYTRLRNDKVLIMVNTIKEGLKELTQTKIEKGEWIIIEYYCYWMLDEDGFIEVKINDEYVTPFNGVDYKYYMPTVYNKESNYFKVGLYRDPIISDSSIVFVDDFEMIEVK